MEEINQTGQKNQTNQFNALLRECYTIAADFAGMEKTKNILRAKASNLTVDDTAQYNDDLSSPPVTEMQALYNILYRICDGTYDDKDNPLPVSLEEIPDSDEKFFVSSSLFLNHSCVKSSKGIKYANEDIKKCSSSATDDYRITAVNKIIEEFRKWRW